MPNATLEFTISPTTTPTPDERVAEILSAPGFGQHFTDHMAMVRYDDGSWGNATIEAHAAIPMMPATTTLHYAQSIFEGMKAYRREDGSVWLFRPEMNAARLNYSARRMAMPELPEEIFLTAVEEVVKIDRRWIPGGDGQSLYLRPFMFASDAFLGVRPSKKYVFCVIASPAGAYFAGGVKPVRIWTSELYVRAAPGGTGSAKFSGNYAASLLAQSEAAEAGCDQVVFLDAVERKYLEELGGMNVFVVFKDGAIATPPLSDTILHGVTRDSVIQIARSLGHVVAERPISIDEWRSGAESGDIVESFACGTAAVVTPIGEVLGADTGFTIGGGSAGSLSTRIRETLLGIQTGTAEDTFGWTRRVI